MKSLLATFRSNPWPACIGGFFSLAILGFAVFIWFCSRHPSELVAPDYYEQEVRYQAQMDRMRNAEQADAAATVLYDTSSQTIRIVFPAHTNNSVTGQVQLYRPSAVSQDRHFPLQPGPDGIQNINAAQLAPGLWKVRVTWTADSRDYYIDQKVVIRSQTS